MNTAASSKVIKKSIGHYNSESWSLGFCRMTALPVRTRKAWALACMLNGVDVSDITLKLKAMLSDMSDSEFKDWTLAN